MDGSPEKPSISELVIVGLDNGRLWILDGEPVWMGHGTYKPCVVCRLRIDDQQIQYDVPGPRGALPAHMSCHTVWRAQSNMRRHNTRP